MNHPFLPLEPLRGAHWQDEALCAQVDPELFWPEKGGAVGPAKAVCRKCSVQQECLDFAIEHRERNGVWGGVAPMARRDLFGPPVRSCGHDVSAVGTTATGYCRQCRRNTQKRWDTTKRRSA